MPLSFTPHDEPGRIDSARPSPRCSRATWSSTRSPPPLRHRRRPQPDRPLGVVSPRDAEDVVRLVEYAAEHGLPLVGRGMGSGLAGGAVGAGIQVDFTRYMNRVLEIAPDGSWARVQPGVVMAYLNQARGQARDLLRPRPFQRELLQPGRHDRHQLLRRPHRRLRRHQGPRAGPGGGAGRRKPLPGAAARPRAAPNSPPSLRRNLWPAGRSPQILPELRANAATIAAAMPRVVKNCCGYRLETVFDERPPGAWHADGSRSPARARSSAPKARSGWSPRPPSTWCRCPRGGASPWPTSPRSSPPARRCPGILALAPTAVEIMDSRFLALVRKHDSRVDAMLPERTDTALLIEFEGADDAEVDEKFAALAPPPGRHRRLKWSGPQTAEETDHLWTVRKSAVALALRMPGPRRALPFIEDVTVHPTEVPGYVDFLQRLFDRESVDAVMYGHVGDGNIHTRPLLDPKDPADLRTMQRLYDEVSAYVPGSPGHHVGRARGRPAPHPLPAPDVRGRRLLPLLSGQECVRSPGSTEPGQEGRAAGGERQPASRSAVRLRLPHLAAEAPPAFPASEYEREIEKCHGCGQCKSTVATTMCPTYKATGARLRRPGEGNLLRAIITGARPEPYGERRPRRHRLLHRLRRCALECTVARQHSPKLMLEAND